MEAKVNKCTCTEKLRMTTACGRVHERPEVGSRQSPKKVVFMMIIILLFLHNDRIGRSFYCIQDREIKYPGIIKRSKALVKTILGVKSKTIGQKVDNNSLDK